MDMLPTNAIFALVLLSAVFLTEPLSSHILTADTTTQEQTGINQIVLQICSRTTCYTFCNKSLHSDPRMAAADQYTVAYLTVSMTYTNARQTWNHITNLLLANHKLSLDDAQAFQRCKNVYGKAVSALETAYIDMNAETFFELADLAAVASRATDDCQAAFGNRNLPPDLLSHNRDLKALSEICAVIGRMYTGEP